MIILNISNLVISVSKSCVIFVSFYTIIQEPFVCAMKVEKQCEKAIEQQLVNCQINQNLWFPYM